MDDPSSVTTSQSAASSSADASATATPQPPVAVVATPRPVGVRQDRVFVGIIAVVGLVTGIVAGLLIPQRGLRQVVSNWLQPEEPTIDSEAQTESGGAMFEVSNAALETYDVRFRRVGELPDSYTEHFSVPAFVRERPTTSNLQASSRMSGVVRRIFVQVGQSVREGDPLLELELTGDELASAQSLLLDSVQQLKIIDDEIARLQPASADGGIARKNLIEKQYEQRRMKSVIEAKRQELLIRGLAAEDVERIIREKSLVRSVVIRVPRDIRPESAPALTQAAPAEDRFQLASQAEDAEVGPWVYSVEAMRVSPGSVLQAGDAVSDLAYHETLLIEGQAYERDLPTLTRIINEQLPVSIEIGDDEAPVLLDDLRVLYMDNHVDNETQTYRFYIEVANEVLAENINEQQRRFRTWRFKPGQRGHVRIPMKEWSDLVVLPADAVAEDGIDQVLFRRIAVHDHFHGETPPHTELRKLVVSVRYRNQQTVVIDHRNQLSPRQTIAVSQADMLLRASSESGGGHGHDHDHDH